MFYSQKLYQDQLGSCTETIHSSGCYITSFCNLLQYLGVATIDPPTLNKLNFYTAGCLFDSQAAATHFGMSYVRTTEDPNVPCIIETNYYANIGYPQHFVLFNPQDNQIVDPLDSGLNEPNWKPNKYPIISYRVFTEIMQTYANLGKPLTPTETSPNLAISEIPPINVSPTPEQPSTGQILPQNSVPDRQSLIDEANKWGNLWEAIVMWIKNLFKK
jgi:hypothetical protein